MKAPALQRCKCGQVGGVNFACIDCCVRWLQRMPPSWRPLNAGVIKAVKGEDYLNEVRQAFKTQGENKK